LPRGEKIFGLESPIGQADVGVNENKTREYLHLQKDVCRLKTVSSKKKQETLNSQGCILLIAIILLLALPM